MDQLLKCLRCGYEYGVTVNPNQETQERTCPKCRSNSVRKISSKKE